MSVWSGNGLCSAVLRLVQVWLLAHGTGLGGHPAAASTACPWAVCCSHLRAPWAALRASRARRWWSERHGPLEVSNTSELGWVQTCVFSESFLWADRLDCFSTGYENNKFIMDDGVLSAIPESCLCNGISWIYDENKLSRPLHPFQISCICCASQMLVWLRWSRQLLLLRADRRYQIFPCCSTKSHLFSFCGRKPLWLCPCMTFFSYTLTDESHPDSVGSCIFRMLVLLNAITHPLFCIRFMQNLYDPEISFGDQAQCWHLQK